MKNLYGKLILIVIIAAFMQNCAGTKKVSKNTPSHIYNKNIETMKSLFEQATRNGSLYTKITLKKRGKLTYKVNKKDYMPDEIQTIPSALVHIYSLDTNKTALAIEEPNYPFSVPAYQKAHYKRIIFREINELLANP